MNFSIFQNLENIGPLAWLGNRNWTIYKHIPDRNAVYFKPRALVFEGEGENTPDNLFVPKDELKRFPRDHWTRLKSIYKSFDNDPVNCIWGLELAKALAGGPKIFRPTNEQCEALEHTSATFSFDTYRQPYPVVILQIPDDYKQRLADQYQLDHGPSFVFIYHDEKNSFIAISAFFSSHKIITHITPKRDIYKTIEESIIANRRDNDENELVAAETVQRLGMNFAMMMTLLGTKVVGPANPEMYKKYEHEAKGMAKGKPSNRAIEAKLNLEASLYLLQFEQDIKFYDEIEEEYEVGQAEDIDRLRKSPKVHWRRGHWRQQPCGPMSRDRKSCFIKPILVRAAFFKGDVKNTTVTYTAKPAHGH